MVWVGMVVQLLASLIAGFSELKFGRGVSPWSRQFLKTNRFKISSGAFALFGFLAAAGALLQERAGAEDAAKRLRQENNQLKGMALAGKMVSPVVRIVLLPGQPLDSSMDLKKNRNGRIPRNH